jgi:hypothetical protein
MRREGEIERLRTDLLKVLRSRFGEDTATELTPTVQGMEDLEVLEQLFDRALSGTGLEELRAVVLQRTPS